MVIGMTCDGCISSVKEKLQNIPQVEKADVSLESNSVKINYIFVLFLFPMIVFSNSLSTKGQFWTGILTGNDIPPGQSSYESTLGYIPTFSLSRDISEMSFVDLEWAYRFDRSYSGDSLVSHSEKNHRLWLRYSSERVEARLGLQKIAFGPALVLRPLSWFDTIDMKDPTGQTDGVEAFRLRWYPSNSLALWSWAVRDDHDVLSFGGRAELSTQIGEWGFTFHHDPSDSLQLIGQSTAWTNEAHNRIALDLRYDGFVGLWNESAWIRSDNIDIQMITVGADYTLPFANGILIMTESMYISNSQQNSDQTLTAFIASVPMGMVNQLMFISQVDWKEDRSYHYLRWSATYDRYSLNFIISDSPKLSAYNIPDHELPNTVAGFGSNFQFMFIYNH